MSSSTLRSVYVRHRRFFQFQYQRLQPSFAAIHVLRLRSLHQLNQLLLVQRPTPKPLPFAKPLASSFWAKSFILATLHLVQLNTRPPVRLAMSAPTQTAGFQITLNPNTSQFTNISVVMIVRSLAGWRIGSHGYLSLGYETDTRHGMRHSSRQNGFLNRPSLSRIISKSISRLQLHSLILKPVP
jgi:hypothetical protein